MPRHSWLTSLYRQLAHRTCSTGVRRPWRSATRESAIIERLEPRQLLSVAAVGFETRVNSYTSGRQDQSDVAMDGAGNYVAVWRSYGQDAGGFGVYAQRYSSTGTAQGGEFKVNTFTTGAQFSPSVAMDAAGDFVITWQSNLQDGSGFGIFAQRFDAMGTAQGGEFNVNSVTTNNQVKPSVAMDATGDFVITWQSYQGGNSLGIYAKRYNAAGTALGSDFNVNTYTTAGSQQSPSVAMDAAGDFVIAWHSYGQDGSSWGIYARRYNSAGTVQGGEFKVNTYTTHGQVSPSVAMDAAGDFVIAWQSLGQVGSSYSIYAQRYNSAGTAQGGEFKVNTYTTGGQGVPSVSMDAVGDFVVTWDSSEDGSVTGVFAQRFNATGTAQGGEFRVNTYTSDQQVAPSVAMDSVGDFVIVWDSNGQDRSGYGVYAQRFLKTVGPIVTAVLVGPNLVLNGDKLTIPTAAFSVNFSDSLNVVPGGANSVTNPLNWQLTRSGADVSNQISGITFGFNVSSNRYVAVVSLVQPLSGGTYQLVARQAIQDLTGQSLDGNADGVTGGDFQRNFAIASSLPSGTETRLNSDPTDTEFTPKIAMDAAGDYVAVWDGGGQDGSSDGVYARRYSASGTAKGGEFRVNTYTTGNQQAPVVAMDAAGSFVIAWQSNLQDGGGYGIYAQRYNAAGTAQGTEFRVNSYTTGNQQAPSVAMDTAGDFVITWQSIGQNVGVYGIFAQRYNAVGTAHGGEFKVNPTTTLDQLRSSVAMDAVGDFVITWDNKGFDIEAQRYSAAGIAQGGEFKVSTFTPSTKYFPSVAMDAAGDFVIAWHSFGQDGSSWGIYAQRYDATGVAQGNEFQVNTNTTDAQIACTVAMGATGDFVIAWQSKLQDGNDYGIYVQRYNASGTTQGGELRVNSYTTGAQEFPSAGIDASGDFVITWQSFFQDSGGIGIYAQRYQVSVDTLNHAPVGTPKTVTTLEDVPYVFKVADFGFSDPNDTPANSFLAVKIVTLPLVGSLADNGVAVSGGTHISVADITSGKLKFTPAANKNGATYASLTFQVQDDGGTANSGIDTDPTPRLMSLAVSSVNDAPIGTSKTVTTAENTAYTLKSADFGFTDPNDNPPNALLAVKFTTLPSTGTLTDNGVPVIVNHFVSATDINGGKLIFTPNANLLDSPLFLCKFQVQDNGGTGYGVNLDPAPKILDVSIVKLNHAPIGTSGIVTAVENTPYKLKSADFGFTDPNDSPANGLLAVKLTLLPSSGTLTDNGAAVILNQFVSASDINGGKLMFTPASNLLGTSLFLCKFQVEDNGGTAAGGVNLDPTAKVLKVNIVKINHAPVGRVTTVSMATISASNSAMPTREDFVHG